MDVNYLPLTDMRIARTFYFTNGGQALYLSSPTEVQRITYSQEMCDNLQVSTRAGKIGHLAIIPSFCCWWPVNYLPSSLITSFVQLLKFFFFIAGNAGRAVYTNRNTRSPEPRIFKRLLWRKCPHLWQRRALCVVCLHYFLNIKHSRMHDTILYC